ncbi:melibiase family protein [Hyaloraphidium curvatum]|nr:melibiase family protein [Hyaloraphidium curvatum]
MLHDHVRYSVIPPQYAERVRPILCNNWEATYFDFDQAKLEKIADKAADLGIELFVLDDGWFGKRDSDNSSLGDWFVDRRKLPGGLAPLADRINARGVSFGLWFEPEMVSPDSDLYRAHPDWCLSFAGRPRTEGRNQLILDMSLPQVRDHLFDAISAVLRSARISYCKVDSNRQFAHSGPAEAWGSERDARYEGYRHRHVLGVYTLFFRLTSAFPDIIWEGCAGGGGRSDYALMSFFGQYWISDDTDAVARLEIQHGASLFLPAMVMSSHVSAVPNHQTGRQTSLRARTAVAMAGVLGYELDLTKMPAKEWDEVARDVAWFKERRHIVQLGDMFRLRSPYGSHAKSNEVAVMFVTKDRSEAMVLHYRPSGSANQKDATVRLHGLDADARYSLDYYYGGARRIMSGQELMARGLVAPYRRGDVAPVVVHLKRDSRAGRL